mmetsp:Transcript_22715/g.39906  ORF Transcript_22715/g.39906 Transcript_22715/m.39906 type:complete len:115 (+) Transcript_22715:837-1181(+)
MQISFISFMDIIYGYHKSKTNDCAGILKCASRDAHQADPGQTLHSSYVEVSDADAQRNLPPIVDATAVDGPVGDRTAAGSWKPTSKAVPAIRDLVEEMGTRADDGGVDFHPVRA